MPMRKIHNPKCQLGPLPVNLLSSKTARASLNQLPPLQITLVPLEFTWTFLRQLVPEGMKLLTVI